MVRTPFPARRSVALSRTDTEPRSQPGKPALIFPIPVRHQSRLPAIIHSSSCGVSVTTPFSDESKREGSLKSVSTRPVLPLGNFTNRIHDQNQSLLFKLPLEIRRQIWSLLIGGRALHVEKRVKQKRQNSKINDSDYSNEEAKVDCVEHEKSNRDQTHYDVRWKIHPCYSRYDPQQLFDISQHSLDLDLGQPLGCYYSNKWNEYDEMWTDRSWNRVGAANRKWCTKRLRVWMNGHGTCVRHHLNAERAVDPETEIADFQDELTFITSCKAIWTEARTVFMSDNTFIFQDGLSLKTFLTLYSSDATNLIRSLHLLVTVREPAPPDDPTETWLDVLEGQDFLRLPHLSAVHLYIKQECPRSDPRRGNGLNRFRERLGQALRQKGIRDLTVVIDNLGSYNDRDTEAEFPAMEDAHTLGMSWATEMRDHVLQSTPAVQL